MYRSLTCLFLILSGPLTAQTASYSYLDQRAPYTNPSPPMLTARNTPRLGATLQLLVPYSWRQRNGVGADFFLATGLGSPAVAVPVLGGYLFTSAEIVVRTPMSPLGIPGTATVSFQVPNDVQLLGLVFYQQVLAAASPRRLGRGGRGSIGR